MPFTKKKVIVASFIKSNNVQENSLLTFTYKYKYGKNNTSKNHV